MNGKGLMQAEWLTVDGWLFELYTISNILFQVSRVQCSLWICCLSFTGIRWSCSDINSTQMGKCSSSSSGDLNDVRGGGEIWGNRWWKWDPINLLIQTGESSDILLKLISDKKEKKKRAPCLFSLHAGLLSMLSISVSLTRLEIISFSSFTKLYYSPLI